MARFPLIQIESIYLTSDGMVSSRHCKVHVTGLDALKFDTAIQVTKSLNGTPYLELSDGQLGLSVTLEIESMEQSVFDDVCDEVQDALDNDTNISISATGGTYGDFSLTVVPGEKPVEFDSEFISTRVRSVKFNFLTT